MIAAFSSSHPTGVPGSRPDGFDSECKHLLFGMSATRDETVLRNTLHTIRRVETLIARTFQTHSFVKSSLSMENEAQFGHVRDCRNLAF